MALAKGVSLLDGSNTQMNSRARLTRNASQAQRAQVFADSAFQPGQPWNTDVLYTERRDGNVTSPSTESSTTVQRMPKSKRRR